MTQYISKAAVLEEIDKLIDYVSEFPASEPEQLIMKGSSLKSLITLKRTIDTLEVKKIPKWKKTIHDNGCWSCEIGVNPSKRLYEYEHYTINADTLFKLLDKEE